MKLYNRSLDFMTLAMASGRKGNVTRAAALFAKALQAPDAVRAIAILEASNKQAFATTAAKKIAAKKVKAAEEFDMGEDEELDGLTGEEEEPAEVEGAVEEEGEEEEDGDFDKQFAKVLSSLTKARAKK